MFDARFEPLPEKRVTVSEDGTVFAQYAQPTTRYAHGILGDDVEAAQLVVAKDGAVYTRTLDEDYVFEDIQPRLVDVDGDGEVEIVTIRSHAARGAGTMIYKITDDNLAEFAWVPEIGTRFRWLNIAAIYDLDDDGAVELAWIQTPHIGGRLKVARIREGELTAITELAGYSNHAIGQVNQCNSVVTQSGNAPTLYVPSQDRTAIVGFRFSTESFEKTESIPREVDFSRPLAAQYDFASIVQAEDHCTSP